MPTRLLFALTCAVAAIVAVSIRLLDAERLSAFGGILSGAGSLLAVIWFSAGLRYQATQLEEQRKQFTAQFHFLQEASRREALLVAKDILERAERQAIAANGNIALIADLVSEYSNFSELKQITESTDPREVMTKFGEWMKKEGPAWTLMQGIKSAAEVYLRAAAVPNIDYTKPADEFFMIYSPHFSSLPFFQTLSGPATILSDFMFRLGPGRDAAKIAFFAASAKAISPEIVKMDKVRTDIAKHIANGYTLPAIAREI
jgi:hypothetical protein